MRVARHPHPDPAVMLKRTTGLFKEIWGTLRYLHLLRVHRRPVPDIGDNRVECRIPQITASIPCAVQGQNCGPAAGTLRRAIVLRNPHTGLIHHSDRGSQYCSDDYRRELRKYGFIASLSGTGNCYDNARYTGSCPKRSSRPSKPNSSGPPFSRHGTLQKKPLALTSTDSTIREDDIQRSAT